jgi:hypothetical protein
MIMPGLSYTYIIRHSNLPGNHKGVEHRYT